MKIIQAGAAIGLSLVAMAAQAKTQSEALVSFAVPFSTAKDDAAIELKNDNFNPAAASQAYLQLGFVTGEKAAVFAQVPATVKQFKVDYFRILIGNSQNMGPQSAVRSGRDDNDQVFFQMQVLDSEPTAPGVNAEIENAAQVTPGPYWNDIPAQDSEGKKLRCAKGGGYVGAALEFNHEGAPSVYRDTDGLNAPKDNMLFAIPGGWLYSVQAGLKGDWILRVVGHEAQPGEC